MDLLDSYKKSNILDMFPKPNVFLSELDTIQRQLGPILDDFNKYFVFYHMNPQISENQQMYENIKNNIQEIYTTLLRISTDVDKNINQINNDYQELNKLIETLKERNTILKQKLGIFEDTYDGSDTMISNYKDLYNLQYLKNFSLGLGLVFSLVLITKIFKGQNSNPVAAPIV
jgi:DNA repair exonuclease SbcCD ATPase subunit